MAQDATKHPALFSLTIRNYSCILFRFCPLAAGEYFLIFDFVYAQTEP